MVTAAGVAIRPSRYGTVKLTVTMFTGFGCAGVVPRTTTL